MAPDGDSQQLLSSERRCKVITRDNGTEFTSKAMQAWAVRHNVRLNFATPGCPTQNAFVEFFNGRMRDEHLNQNLFFGLENARISTELWRHFYNNKRPHSSLGLIPPASFALTKRESHVQQAAR